MQYTESEQTVKNEITRLLPNVEIHNVRLGNKSGVNESVFYIPKDNRGLSDSEYYYRGELNFIHFTSLIAIESIINSRSLRLYNLNNLNDPREYSYAGNLFAFNEKMRQDAKDNFFLLSMCSPELLITDSHEIEFNMWRLYANNGEGVGIELNFKTTPNIHWKDYFLSEVKYGTKSKTALRELSDLIDKYKKETPSIGIDLGQIACFHKSELFSLEKEIRLLYDKREIKLHGETIYKDANSNIESPIIRIDITKSINLKKEISYLELPIYFEGFEAIGRTYDNSTPIPVPKIERIILGYRYYNSFKKAKKLLLDICDKRLGYRPIIELSRLAELYHELK